MSEEKLPEYVASALLLLGRAIDNGDVMAEIARREDVQAAIHRYAREREAAALERAAQILDALAVYESDNGVADSLPDDCATRIRALIHKEPANG